MSGSPLVGVDGGGSHRRARIRSTDGTLVGEAVGGSANVFGDIDAARGDLLAALRKAPAVAGSNEAALVRCQPGLQPAGANVPSVAAAFSVRALPFAADALEADALDEAPDPVRLISERREDAA